MKKDSKKIAVLIPCYNESKTIEKVVKDYKEVLPEADIYVYDNNSSDGTDEIARKAGAIVKYEYRQGKGNVIRSMFKDIDADCYLMIDGDDTYPKENAREMCDLVLNKGADMVVGDRLSSTYFTENKRPFHNTGNRLVMFRAGQIRVPLIRFEVFTGALFQLIVVAVQGIEALQKRFFPIKNLHMAFVAVGTDDLVQIRSAVLDLFLVFGEIGRAHV